MQRRIVSVRLSRRGSLIPAVAAALLVVGAAMALVLDRLWIDAAALEMRTATEAAALAGAAGLANDDRLRSDFVPAALAERVRDRAANVAAKNLVVGEPLQLDTSSNSDILIGQLVDRDGRMTFLETESDARAVTVIGRRTRSRSNPIALLMRDVSGRSDADLVVSSQASIDNRVVGVQPIDGAAAPLLPLAILESDPAGLRRDTWVAQVEQREGADSWSFDAATHSVRPQPDGIPEIVLRSARLGADAQEQAAANVRCVDLGTRLGDRGVSLQVEYGISKLDLAPWGGSLRFDLGTVQLDSTTVLPDASQVALQHALGQPRVCLVYAQSATGGTTADAVVTATRLVAGRVMAVAHGSRGEAEIVFQPCVMTTRCAILADGSLSANAAEPYANPYIYKLHLTH
jgi:hypothetical protein